MENISKIIRIPNFVILTCLSVFIASACTQSVNSEEEAQEIFQKFYNDNVPESINTRHLENAGKSIVPYLLREIQNRDMPKRGYAILAFGKIGDKSALKDLQIILNDVSETEVIRGDALRSIWHLDKRLGKQLSEELHGKSEYIDRNIELLEKGSI